MTELREAIGIVSSENPRSLQNRNIPWKQAVEKVFAPLIETQEDPDNLGERFCYLFHSTVRDFLIGNPTIFQEESPSPAIASITELTIANAGLLYLSQDRYSQLLTRETEQWMTTSKDSVKDHHLLTYAAKYWDKHFDHVEETPELRQKIEKFLTSSNFRSTIQLQSLFVQGHFEIYTACSCASDRRYTKRVFPQWLASHSKDGYSPFSRNYRSFISEWSSLLNCAQCDDPLCDRHSAVKQCQGELDRCLWGALGPQNFLSSNRGRYTSFIMCGEEDFGPGSDPYREAISPDGSKIVVIQQLGKSADAAPSTFQCKIWGLSNREIPRLLGTSNVLTSFDGKRWADAEAKPVSFTPDLAFLRIGTQIFSVNAVGEYHEIGGSEISAKYNKTCFEDITNRGSLLVLASRRKMPAVAESRGREAVELDQPSDTLLASSDTTASELKSGKGSNVTGCRNLSQEPTKSDHASDTSPVKGEDSSNKDGSDSESSCASEDVSEWNSAEESWSEGSTEVYELGNPLTSSDETSSNFSEVDADSDNESESPQDDATSDTAVNGYGQLYDESDSDGGDIDFDCGSDNESYDGDYEYDWSDENNHDEDYHFDSDDEERLVRQMAYSRRDRKRDAKVQQGVMMIYDLAAHPPNPVFTFTQQLPIMLYQSPPVIHPTKPLVVWPLCGGDVLFADIEGKSYFVRRARTTTRKSMYSAGLFLVSDQFSTNVSADLTTKLATCS